MFTPPNDEQVIQQRKKTILAPKRAPPNRQRRDVSKIRILFQDEMALSNRDVARLDPFDPENYPTRWDLGSLMHLSPVKLNLSEVATFITPTRAPKVEASHRRSSEIMVVEKLCPEMEKMQSATQFGFASLLLAFGLAVLVGALLFYFKIWAETQ